MTDDLRQTSRVLRKSAFVSAPPAEVFRAWTTAEGVKSFFGPDVRLDARPGGAFEVLFLLDNPPGLRGSEGCVFTTVDAGESRLGFTWNFPPSLPTLRNEHTSVAVELIPEGKGTRLVLFQMGWKGGPDWDEGFTYFDRAWTQVLDQLVERFTKGPIDWDAR